MFQLGDLVSITKVYRDQYRVGERGIVMTLPASQFSLFAGSVRVILLDDMIRKSQWIPVEYLTFVAHCSIDELLTHQMEYVRRIGKSMVIMEQRRKR